MYLSLSCCDAQIKQYVLFFPWPQLRGAADTGCDGAGRGRKQYKTLDELLKAVVAKEVRLETYRRSQQQAAAEEEEEEDEEEEEEGEEGGFDADEVDCDLDDDDAGSSGWNSKSNPWRHLISLHVTTRVCGHSAYFSCYGYLYLQLSSHTGAIEYICMQDWTAALNLFLQKRWPDAALEPTEETRARLRAVRLATTPYTFIPRGFQPQEVPVLPHARLLDRTSVARTTFRQARKGEYFRACVLYNCGQ